MNYSAANRELIVSHVAQFGPCDIQDAVDMLVSKGRDARTAHGLVRQAIKNEDVFSTTDSEGVITLHGRNPSSV